jgi:integrase/recombinase XerD
MTKILHNDPDRCCKKLEAWPEADRRLWEAALLPGDLLEEGGSRARYAGYSNRKAISGYGRWLSWLERQGLLDAVIAPAERIIPARVAAYIADLEKHNAMQTLLNRLQELRAVAVVMDPHRDWSWIYRNCSRIRSRHRPARPKRHRLVPARELFDLGLSLIVRAVRGHTACARAVVYRDGLLIALLAARPLRLRNLVSLALDRTLVFRGTKWWIEFPAADTKAKEPIEVPWPEPLLAPLETYLACHRGVLAQLRGGR